MNNAYTFQSSLILYFLRAAGNTFQHGSSNVTRNDLAALCAASFARDRSFSDGPADDEDAAGAYASGGVGLVPVVEEDIGARDCDVFAEREEERECWPLGGVAAGADPGPDGGVVVCTPRIELSDMSRLSGGG